MFRPNECPRRCIDAIVCKRSELKPSMRNPQRVQKTDSPETKNINRCHTAVRLAKKTKIDNAAESAHT